MQRSILIIAAFALTALAGQASAIACSATPCPAGAPQLCCDCANAVSSSLVTPDDYQNTAASLMQLCTKCTSDLCKQCLAAPAGKYGTSNLRKSGYPANTQPFLAVANAALFNLNLPTSADGITGSTKTLCPLITTSDTLKCFDLGYGSRSDDNYGFFEALCVAAQSDLQRRCMWQYTFRSGPASEGPYDYEGLPTTKFAILQYTIPLCLHLQSQAQYSCLKNQVKALDTAGGTPSATTTSTVASACGIQ